MGIYTRDQIQYANMLQNALQNRARAIEREGDNLRGRGQMWGSALNTAGNTVKDARFSIASYQHADEQAQLQRDFQAEQAALRNKETMERLAREQQFQAQQNELNRQNTLAIAQNRFEQGQAEKRASDRKTAITNLDILNATVKLADDELRRTDDPQRIAVLNKGKEEALAKIEGYYRDYPDLRPVEPKVPQDNTPAGPETPADTPSETTDMMQSESMAKFSTELENSKNSKDTESALQGLKNINTNMLNTSQKESLQKAIANGEAKLASQKNQEARRVSDKKNVMNWSKTGDPLPSGWIVRSREGVKIPMKKINGVWKTREEVYQ